MTAGMMEQKVTIPKVHRIEVRARPGEVDPLADAVLRQARAALGGVVSVNTARVYLIQGPLSDSAIRSVATELLADPINQQPIVGSAPVTGGASTIEIHYRPGVMDPVAQSTREAIVEMVPGVTLDQIEVRTGFRYDLFFSSTAPGPEALRKFAASALANPVIQDIHDRPQSPDKFPAGSAYGFKLRHVPLLQVDDAALAKLSRDAHLFLSPAEMKAIQTYFRQQRRDPTDIELETLAQTWSEHCVHKTLKSTVVYRAESRDPLFELDWSSRPGHTRNPDGSVTIHNLLKSTIAAATHKLMEEDHFREWCVSVFKDNAGIVRFDEEDAVCIKVETHNHPSAIEPYGGAATGIGGCIRDVMGTGLAARPIANTDVFCVAPPDAKDLPKGVIPPRRTLEQVVTGIRDYGNRMGIPTVNGAVYFHHDYVANPLVFAGCVGLLPLDKCFGAARPGDHIIALGGRTGRDGIHGATFSSAELTDSHADEFAHAVQIGNAITQKKMLDVILQARDEASEVGGCLYHAITDCGAGGFSSAVGEMGRELGASVHLERAPLKYQGLSYTEIWISEAQERMVLAVPPQNLARLRALCEAEDVEMCDLGEFGAPGSELLLYYHGTQVGRLSMNFLHDGIPMPTREAVWNPPHKPVRKNEVPALSDREVRDVLLRLLSHPNIAGKHWIIRQYDHEVQGGSVVKPLVGASQDGPSDAAVLRPKLHSRRAIAVGCGLCPAISETTPGGDSYHMAVAAIDEAVRNVVCVGADPDRIAILDNFCWPRCDDPAQLATLVRAAEGCYDAALAYRTPFISGKDSLSNQFMTEDGRLITIPPTLLITALGIVPDSRRARTMDAKAVGNFLLAIGGTTDAIAGSHYAQIVGIDGLDIPRVDLKSGPANARAVSSLISAGLVVSAHDCSDGGLLVAASEMAFAGRIGLEIMLDALLSSQPLTTDACCFAETPSRYLLEIAPTNLSAVLALCRSAGIHVAPIGTFVNRDRLTVHRDGKLIVDEKLTALRDAWLAPLNW